MSSSIEFEGTNYNNCNININCISINCGCHSNSCNSIYISPSSNDVHTNSTRRTRAKKSQEYWNKRESNREAVRRFRHRWKLFKTETEVKLQQLLQQNQQLHQTVNKLANDVFLLKRLISYFETHYKQNSIQNQLDLLPAQFWSQYLNFTSNENGFGLYKGTYKFNPVSELTLQHANRDEFVSRNLLNGTSIFVDHRCAPILGYLPSEIIGKSGWSHVVPEDLPISLFSFCFQQQRQTFGGGESSIVCRCYTLNREIVCLKSIPHLQFDPVTGQLHHILWVTTRLSDEEGAIEMDRQAKLLTPHIKIVELPE